MNIFYFHDDPIINAQMHCDRHCVKMILEYAQLLSTAHHELKSEEDILSIIYKPTHKNHPCAIWARASSSNYQYLFTMFIALCDEYSFRYHKEHKTHEKLWWVLGFMPINIPRGIPLTEPPQCMPDKYKDNLTTVAYQNYFNGDKQRMGSWKKRQPPTWWIPDVS